MAKIAIDISQIVYDTGVSQYTKNLVEYILKTDPKDKHILFGSSLRQQKKLKEFAASICHKPKTMSKIYPFPPAFLDLLWNRLHVIGVENFIGKIDIFHSSDWTQPPSGAKKVTTIYDLVINYYPESLHPKIVAVQKRRLEWVKKEVDYVITISDSAKKDIVKFLKIPERKISVVYPACNEIYKPRSQNECQKVLQKYKIGRPFFLYVGTIEPRKNLLNLVGAFRKLVNSSQLSVHRKRNIENREQRTENLQLVIVGKSGWGKVEIPKEKNIKVLGYVEKEDLPFLYSSTLALVYPSFYEGFGMPIIEAMACGAPVICSNISSMPEAGGNAAIYIDPKSVGSIKEALEKVVNYHTLEYDKYMELKEKSQKQAQKFSWEDSAKKTLATYKKLA